MTQISIDSVKSIVNLLDNFSKGLTHIVSEEDRKDAVLSHYYTEIVRFWNKINYVVKKSLRSIEPTHFSEEHFTKVMYAAYRILWENASLSDAVEETQLEAKNLFNKISTFSWDIALKHKPPAEKLSILESIPSFFIKKLQNVMDYQILLANLQAMNNIHEKEYFTVHLHTNLDFVLNTCFFQNLHPHITAQESLFQKDADIPNLYHIPIKYKNQFVSSELFSSGEIIILDKGSATIVDLLSPKQNELIFDMCAAPGIKTNLILNNTKEESHVVAADFSWERTKQMNALIDGILHPKLHIMNADSILPLFRSALRFDKILVDAPCTGSGTFLSNPELKWRQNEAFLHQNCVLQEKLLKSALTLLKPEGILVYSTCSLYPEEGEMQIQKVRALLEPMDLPKWLGESYKINNTHIAGTARLFPAQHGTQGFFIGKFKKKA